MKIALALFHYFPYGGLERDMLAVARAFVARGHAVTVYTADWQGERPADIPVVELPVRALTNHGRNRAFVQRFREATAQRDDRVVIGFNKMPGLDFYYAADSCFAEKAHEQRGALYRLLPRSRSYLDYERAVFGEHEKTRILMIAPTQQAVFQRYYHTPAERMYLLPPGISRDRINTSGRHEQVLHDELGIDHEQKIILMIGSGFRTKGLDRAIAAVAALPLALRQQTHLVIAGSDDSTAFAQQAQQAGLEKHIHFLGGRNDVAMLLRGADVLIHPARREAAGLALLEAAVACLPVLVTDVCGHAHYIAEQDLGIVLPAPFQQTQLDHALESMLTNAQQVQRWRENGRRFAETADIYSMPERFVQYVEAHA